MTLYAIISILQRIATLQPNVRSSSCGSLFEYMNTNPNINYNVVHITQTSHRLEEDVDYYGLTLYFISRLDDTLENNRLLIQSTGKEVLTNIIKTFAEEYGVVDYPTMIFTPFTQRFQDECAGVYVSVELGIPIDYICPEDDYGEIGEIIPDKDVKLQTKKITIQNNGTTIVKPDLGYDGLSKVTVEVDVEGGEARLYDLTATTNSTYTPAEGFQGFGKVVVDVPGGSSANLGSLSVNEEGEFHHTYNAQERGLDGFSSVTVNVLCDDCDCSTAYTQGYQEGVADQKDKLTSVSITRNGQYTRGDGYSAITVNVPTSRSYVIKYTSNTNAAVNINQYCQIYNANNDRIRPVSNTYGEYGVLTFSEEPVSIYGRLWGNGYENEMNITSVELPSSVKVLANVFPHSIALTSCTLNEGLYSIGQDTFYASALKEITIPASTYYIDTHAFCNTPLSSVTFEKRLAGAFWTERIIETNAFADCLYLNDIYIKGELNQGNNDIPYLVYKSSQYQPFFNTKENGEIHMSQSYQGHGGSNIQLWQQALPTWTFVYDL